MGADGGNGSVDLRRVLLERRITSHFTAGNGRSLNMYVSTVEEKELISRWYLRNRSLL
jgi:hypothetical protein